MYILGCVLAWCVLAFASNCDAYNILVATPNAVKSESSLMDTIAYQLVIAGHRITYISGYEGVKKHDNLTLIFLPEIVASMPDVGKSMIDVSTTELFKAIEIFFKRQNDVIWKNSRVIELWKQRGQFDLVVTLSYYNEGIFPFLMDNDIPLVQVISMGAEHLAISRQSNWITPAVLPSMFTNFCEEMTFWERFTNLIATLRFHYEHLNVVYKYTEPVMEVFPQIGDYNKYYDRVALTLINGHYSMDGPLPLLPNQVEIGTINIQPRKPLKQDLASFIDNSGEAGVIYFSLGSITRSADLSQNAKDQLVEAFRRIPQRVLWKYEDTDMVMPPNVLIQKWLPQQDILAHPKTRVFMSHCGTFSIQEAQYFGVPILALPVMFDQPRNAAKLVKKRYAISLTWHDLTADDLVRSLDTLVNETSYGTRMRAVSRILQDQKEPPAQRAVWWIEYVARHKSSQLLQYAGKRLSLLQYLMIDVVLCILFAFHGILLLVFVVAWWLCCGKKRTKAKKESKQKLQ